MCGIAGCVASAGERPDTEVLERMADALDHRGPDDRGIEVHENVGLVSTRLAIVDPSPAGHQPMWDRSRRWLLAFNGEVYNHRELRAELPAGAWRGHSDTETLVQALAAWGEDAVERCNGALALAALDRARRRLLLARDRFGKKPLYFARHRGTLWFASEMKGLLAAGVPARIEPAPLAHAAVRGWLAGRKTPLEGVERLPAGTSLTVSLDTLEASERRWYDPPRSVDPDLARELESLPRDALVDRLEEALRGAVRRRLLSDVPLGTMCSGGIDSTLITALAREEHGSVSAFNGSLVDEGRADEGPWGEHAARSIGVALETVSIDVSAWRRRVVESVRAHEYPLPRASAVAISAIAGRARSRGVKVLLTGEGADELFAGYALLHGKAELGFNPIALTAFRYGAALARGRLRVRPLLRQAGVWPPWASVEPAPSHLEEADAVRARAADAYAHHDDARARFESALLVGLTVSQFPFLLNRMDKDAMSESVETRVPFLDPEVVRLVLNLPLEHRTMPRPKGILRDVGLRHLPRSIAYRPKYPGLGFDARRRMRQSARTEFLRNGVIRDALAMPEDRWDALLAGSSHHAGLGLWTAEIWARLFVEGHGVERIEADLWGGRTDPLPAPVRSYSCVA